MIQLFSSFEAEHNGERIVLHFNPKRLNPIMYNRRDTLKIYVTDVEIALRTNRKSAHAHLLSGGAVVAHTRSKSGNQLFVEPSILMSV